MALPSNRGTRLHGLFYICLFAAYLFMLFGVAHLSDADVWIHTLIRIAAVTLELLFLAALTLYPLHRWQRGRRTGWFVLYMTLMTIICLGYVSQFYSIYVSDNFISALAMQNIRYAALTQSTTQWVMLGVGALALIVLGVYSWRSARWPAGTAGRRSVVIFVALAVLYAGLFTQQRRHNTLEPEYRQVPLASLLANARVAFLQGRQDVAATDMGASTAGQTCFSDPNAGKLPGFPLQKNVVYAQPLPYPRTAGASAHPNVILIFTEGMSARLMGVYGGQHAGLTPNLDSFATHAMRVTDYYNHTAATFRGIIGQNTSGYTYAGGAGEDGWTAGDHAGKYAQIKRQSLADILDGRGYNSYFFTPEQGGGAFEQMLSSLGFRQLYGYHKVSALLGGKVTMQNQTDQLSDGSLYEGLTDFLKARTAAADSKPFVLGAYNIGTHAFIPMVTGGVAYGDGASQTLNKFHNYDAAIGKFLDYFLASPYAANTILIFTTDHATYPDREYREVAGKDLKPYFVDRIPLLIYDPTHKLPPTLDAQGRNSLDMAPTLLQLLGIQHVANSFLGNSLFEQRGFPVGITALGSDFYYSLPSGVSPLWATSPQLKSTVDCEKSVVEHYYQLEAKNRLFNDGTGQGNTTTLAAPAPAPTPTLTAQSAPPPLGNPMCVLDTLDGKPVVHNGSDVVLLGGKSFDVTGWLVDSNHHAVSDMQLVLTPVSGGIAKDLTAETGGKRLDVARALQNLGATLSGFSVRGDLSRLAPGEYQATAKAKSDGANLQCNFNVTFKMPKAARLQ